MDKLISSDVILRYLLDDIEDQSNAAKDVLSSGAFTIGEVIADVVGILEKVYEVDKNTIKETLTGFLGEIYIDDKSTILEALNLYSAKNIGYSNALLLARHQSCGDKVFTFDKKLRRLTTS